MAEDRRGERITEIVGKSHRLNLAALRLDIFRLLTTFLASKRLIALSDGTDYCSIWTMRDEFEESEITRLLITVAVQTRFLDEDMKAFKKKYKEPLRPDVIVGSLHVERSGDQDLTLREACNKVIHAERMNFDRYRRDHPTRKYLRPIVHLYGTQGLVKWKATLRVEAFCCFAFELAFGMEG